MVLPWPFAGSIHVVSDDTLTGTSSVYGGELSPRPIPQLVLLLRADDPMAPGSRHTLDHTRLVQVGRGDAHDVRRSNDTLSVTLPDGRVSSAHAVLTRDRTGWAVEDKGSKNGTLVNGQRVQRKLLTDGDLLEIGRAFFLFRDQVAVNVNTAPDTTEASVSAPVPEWRTFHDPLLGTYAHLAKMAPAQAPVLVLGETGVGKEVVARSVHRLSGRRGDCVAVNCAAIAESLVESELFGHAKGAFTGSDGSRLGWMRSADGGTLFLDEIGELRAQTQAILLRALETRTVVPVGSDRAVPVDFRLIAATNRDLDAEVDAGRFRADLRARLGQGVARLAPLRERREDLGLLLRAVLSRHAAGAVSGLRTEAARRLLSHEWPGNVRDLVSVIEYVIVQSAGGAVAPEHLPPSLRGSTSTAEQSDADDMSGAPANLRDEVAALEHKRIDEALDHHPSAAAAAEALGLPERTLYNKMKSLGISKRKK